MHWQSFLLLHLQLRAETELSHRESKKGTSLGCLGSKERGNWWCILPSTQLLQKGFPPREGKCFLLLWSLLRAEWRKKAGNWGEGIGMKGMWKSEIIRKATKTMGWAGSGAGLSSSWARLWWLPVLGSPSSPCLCWTKDFKQTPPRSISTGYRTSLKGSRGRNEFHLSSR